MKITEMTNDQAADALIRMAVPFENICNDEEAIKIIDEYNGMKDVPVIKTIGNMLPKLIMYVAKAHRDDLYEIVGALTMKPKAAVAKMNFFETIRVVRESWDEVASGFFTSSVKRMKESAGKSSAPSSGTDTTD